MKNLFTLILFSLASVATAKDDPQITGKIVDEKGAGIPYATVLLQKASDTTMVKADISDEEGAFTFVSIPAGHYFIEVSYVGYSNIHSSAFEYDGKTKYSVPVMTLKEQAEQLAEVVVKSTRPIVEVQPDKTVFNVDGSVNAVGNNALELLRKSPGVVVDNNESLLIQGKNGVQVYIDGKKSPLSAADLANYLKSLQSTEIDAIEIITNPSAKYDAEGNAGIINIRLKKDQNLGFNGNLNGGYRYGKTSKYNGSLSLNYRDKYFNTFGSYNIYKGDNINDMDLYRELGGNLYDQNGRNTNSSENHGFRFGTDLFLSEKSTLGFLINGNLNDHRFGSNTHTEIAGLTDRVIDSFLIASNVIDDSRKNVNFNVNYAFKGANGQSLNIDVDYGLYRNTGISFQPNRYVAADGETTLYERIFSNETPTDIDIYTAKTDYETKLWGGRLGLGAKTSVVITDNTFDSYDIIEDERIKNPERSNNFVYRENVNAAYTTWQKQLSPKINFMAGLRLEHTYSKGDLTSTQSETDESVERDYINLFPSGGITWQANDHNSLRIGYSRRIDRPNYQDLNPFAYQLDELTYQQGNPFLTPQYSNAYSLTHTYKHTLNSTLSYTVTNDLFTQITDAVDERAAIITNINLARQTNLALTVSYPFAVTKWWNVYTTATAFRVHNEANIEGKIIDLNANAFNFYGQNTFLLPKGFKGEISGWYNAPSIWGNLVTNSQYDVSAGISKSFWNDKANLKLTVSDIFYTNGWGGYSRFGGLYIRAEGNWESRQVRMNFTYQFGNKQVKAARNRKTGMEEEQNRIGSSN
jgi:iron complex outermembrane recepter protein